MDPVTAVCNVITSLNTVLAALINKASTPQVDAMIQAHLDARARFEALLEKVGEKIGLVPKP